MSQFKIKKGRNMNFKPTKDDLRRAAMQHGQQRMAQLAPNILPGVRADALKAIRCNVCGNDTFSPAHYLRAASPFQTVNSTPSLVQFPVGFLCTNCKAINPFRPWDHEDKDEPVGEDTPDPAPDLGVSVTEDIKSDEKLG